MEQRKTPSSVGIIVDGNRRWAKKRSLPVAEWHKEGAANIKRIIRAAGKHGIGTIYFYVFSTENWGRGTVEVQVILKLLHEWLARELDDVVAEGVRVRFLGERERFSKELRELMDRLERESAGGKKSTVAFCLSYGGRLEILRAAHELLEEGKKAVTEAEFSSKLWSAGLPDPDLIIRTGGARRLSNFLTWQSVYSELFFTDTLWPDFGEEEFGRIIKEFGERERRWGK